MSSRWRRILATLAAPAITAATLPYLLGDDALRAMGQAWRAADWPMLLAAACLAPTIHPLRAWRFNRLLRGREARPPFYPMLRICILAQVFAYVLPFKAGELSFPLMVRRQFDIPAARAVGALALVRLQDLLMVGVLGAVALGLAGGATPLVPVGPWPVAAVGLVAVLLLRPCISRLRAWSSGRLDRFPRCAAIVEAVAEGAAAESGLHTELLVSAISFLLWSTQLVTAFLAASALGPLPFTHVVLAGCAAILCFALPINGVAGLGLVQTAWSLTLSGLGHDWTLAVASAFLWHGVLLCASLVPGAIIWPLASTKIARDLPSG